MKIKKFYTSPLQTNTYLAVNENNNCGFIVDPGSGEEEIVSFIDENKIAIDAILLTHAHFDHIGGVAALLRAFDKRGMNPLVVLHSMDKDKIASFKNLAFSMGCSIEKFVPDVLLKGGETLNVAGYKIDVIHTPGHSKGGVCYKVENVIFVGDTVFYSSYGRYDFYDGNFKELKNSIMNKLFNIKGNYTLYPGHGNKTTLDFEKKYNAILQDDENIKIID